MKLVKEIRDGIADSDTEIASLMRKAKILAVTLNNQEFKEWISFELNGYPNGSEIPEYRKVSSPPLGSFSGPFGSRASGVLLPISQIPDFMRENATSIHFPNPIKEIESMARTGGPNLRHPWPAEAAVLLREHIELTGGYVLTEVYQPISQAQLEKITDSVRTRLLDFLLALQEINPRILESEEALRSLPKEAVNQVFHVSVYGSNNILATGSGFSQSVTQEIRQNDQAALLLHLRQMGISEEDLSDLENAIKEDGVRAKGDFGDKVKTWMSKAMVKAIDGTWKIATTAAPEVLMKALSAYYGWN